MKFTRICCLILLEISAFGCASSLNSVQLSTDVNYQRDIVMDVHYEKDGKWAGPLKIHGMGVVYDSSQYKIKVMPPGKADMITVTSCHREVKTPNPKGAGFWNKGYEFRIPYQNTIDKNQLCSFDIGVYEARQGRHAWGTLAIMNPKFKLEALTKCNGRVKKYGGTSVCQAKEGLIQEYIFDRKVSYAKVPGCEIDNLATKEKYAKVWRFLMPPGGCEIRFIDIEDPVNFRHQAFFWGYQSIPIRAPK